MTPLMKFHPRWLVERRLKLLHTRLKSRYLRHHHWHWCNSLSCTSWRWLAWVHSRFFQANQAQQDYCCHSCPSNHHCSACNEQSTSREKNPQKVFVGGNAKSLKLVWSGVLVPGGVVGVGSVGNIWRLISDSADAAAASSVQSFLDTLFGVGIVPQFDSIVDPFSVLSFGKSACKNPYWFSITNHHVLPIIWLWQYCVLNLTLLTWQ